MLLTIHQDDEALWVEHSMLLKWRMSFNQSIKIYIAPLQDPYSEAIPIPGQAEKNSLEKVVELITRTVWEVP